MHVWNKNHALVAKMNNEHDGVLFADNYTSDMTDEEFAQMTGAIVPEDEEVALGIDAAEVDQGK